MGLNTLGVAHDFLKKHVKPGAFCIDATAGRGGDTLLLCRLAGEQGHVLALDIQQEAVDSTREALVLQGMEGRAQVVLDSHANLGAYAQPGSVDCIVFNFGWLPGGDHTIFTKARTSVAAVEKALTLLKPGGVMSLCIYYGRNNGLAERDALLEYLAGVDDKQYTVLVCSFHNRGNCPPIPVLIWKQG